MTDDEILCFYRKLKNILEGKPYKIIYLDVDDIAAGITCIRKERYNILPRLTLAASKPPPSCSLSILI